MVLCPSVSIIHLSRLGIVDIVHFITSLSNDRSVVITHSLNSVYDSLVIFLFKAYCCSSRLMLWNTFSIGFKSGYLTGIFR